MTTYPDRLSRIFSYSLRVTDTVIYNSGHWVFYTTYCTSHSIPVEKNSIDNTTSPSLESTRHFLTVRKTPGWQLGLTYPTSQFFRIMPAWHPWSYYIPLCHLFTNNELCDSSRDMSSQTTWEDFSRHMMRWRLACWMRPALVASYVSHLITALPSSAQWSSGMSHEPCSHLFVSLCND